MIRTNPIIRLVLLHIGILAAAVCNASSLTDDSDLVYLHANVVDETSEYPIVSAKISVADTMGVVLCDSIGYHSYNGYRSSYETIIFDGSFPLRSKYKITISAKGYETQLFDITTPKDHIIELGTIMMNPPRREHTLREVTVTASKIKMVMKGDTLEYDATAFSLQEGSMLDGLIAALPGATLDNDGRIMVNGRFVSELLVNGRHFFAGDPQVALRNLPAYTVKKVQVYHKTPDEFRGIKNRDNSIDPLVMDVGLKKEYMNGWIANAEGGYGSVTNNGWSSRWMGRLFAMRYDKYSYIALHSSANNLNDPEAVGSKGEWKKPNVTSGEITTKRIGIEYNTDWHDQKYAGINTKLNLVRQNTLNTIDNLSEVYLPGGNTFSQSYSAANRDTWQGSWYGEMSRNLEKTFVNRLWVSANLRYENGRLRRESTAAESNALLPTVYTAPGSVDYISDMLYHRQENTFTKDHKFTHDYRLILIFQKNFSINAWAGWSNATNRMDGSDIIDYTSSPDLNINRLRREDTPSRNYFYELMPGWSLYSKQWNFRCNYNYKQEFRHGERTIDELNNNLSSENAPSAAQGWEVDYANSYRTTRRAWTNTLSPNITYQWGGENARDYSVALQSEILHSIRSVNDFRNYIPQAIHRKDWCFNGNIRIGKGSSWWGNGYGVTFSLNQTLPDIMYMLNVRDSSNPLVIELGNPNLRKSTKYGVSAFYRQEINKGARIFSGEISYSRINNALARARTFNRISGVTTWQPDNINGNWNLNGEFYYAATMLPGQKLSLTNTLRPRYDRSVDFSSDSDTPERSAVDNWSIGNEFNAKYDILSNLAVSAKVNLGWTSLHSRNNLFKTFDYTDINYGVGVKYTLPGGIDIDTDLMAYCRRGYEQSNLNTTDWVWNLQLSKTFGRAKQFTIKAIGFDILHQLPTIKQVVNAQGRTETRYNSQPSYAILTLLYRLDIKPKRK